MALLQIEEIEKIEFITLTHGKSNTITPGVIEELLRCLERLAPAPDVRGIVLTGSGKFFSSGFDLVELYNYSHDEFEAFFRKFSTLYENLFALPKPTVASINGHAIAGGYILASACDFRIMAEGDYRVGVNEIKVGVPYPPMPILASFMSGRNTREVILQGKLYAPREALSLGLVDQIVSADRLREETLKLTKDLCSADPKSYQYSKGYIQEQYLRILREKNETRIKDFLECWFSPDTRERIKIIVEKLRK